MNQEEIYKQQYMTHPDTRECIKASQVRACTLGEYSTKPPHIFPLDTPGYEVTGRAVDKRHPSWYTREAFNRYFNVIT